MKRQFFSAPLAAIAVVAERNDATMAAPAAKAIKIAALPENEIEQLRTQLNNLLASFRIAMTKLDNDAGVTDVNYFTLTCDAALGAAAPTVLTVL